jgi:hypothetical protein
VEQLLDTFPSGWIHRIFEAISKLQKKQLSTVAAGSEFISASVSRAINSSSTPHAGLHLIREADRRLPDAEGNVLVCESRNTAAKPAVRHSLDIPMS